MLRLYRALLRLLPPHVRERDAEEMARTLADQIAASPAPRAVWWRALSRFPLVLALEWRDALLSEPGPARPTRPRGARMEAIVRMMRQGARGLARTPAFSLSVLLLLGAGVGSVSAIFAVVDHVLLRPLPYPDADRLVVVEGGPHSMPALRDMFAMRSIEAWGAAWTSDARLTDHGDPLRVNQAVVTGGFFPMFGARAAIGRLLQPADSLDVNTAVLSYGTWVRVFGADRSVIGRTVRIDDTPITVIGVLDPGFALPEALVDAAVDFWRPPDLTAEYMTKRDYWMFRVAGRLGAGRTIAQAQQEATRIAHQRAKDFPRYVEDGRVLELPVRTLREATIGSVDQPLRALFGAVILLLLVACANVTHLFLARGVGRSREVTLRRALGARTGSLVAQLLIESAMLGVAGAVLGAWIAYAGVRAFLALMPDGLPRATTIAVDARVLLFAGGIGILTAIVFGLMPALRLARRGSGGDPLRASGRSLTGSREAHRMRSVLVVGEVALSLVLVAQAGWLLRSYIRMSQAELGFRTSGIVEVPMSIPTPPPTSGDSSRAQVAAWHRRLETIRESLARTPGVQAVTFGLTMPLEFVGAGRCCWSARPTFAGKDRLERSSVTHPISEAFFDVFAIRFVAGEGWSRAAAEHAPYPAVINEELARQVFGEARAALGTAFTLDHTDYRVVGVAQNTRHYGVDQPYGTAVYIPANALPFAPGSVTMAVRSDRTDGALANDLRSAIWREEPELPVPSVNTVEELARRDSAQRRFDAMLFGTFSVVTLLLVAGGLAGTLLYMVSLERRSLGIRLALGATPRGLERGVLTRGVGLAAVGVVIGTIGAGFAGRLIESRLYGVEARDARTLAVAVGVLLLVALLASWVPARRAAVTNPIESLRAD